jgi:phosphate transport system protein
MDMGQLAVNQLGQLQHAIADGKIEDLQEVADGESALDVMEIKIDKLIVRLLARRSPLGSDLRFIVASSRMVNDLERIGDETIFLGRQIRSDASGMGVCDGVPLNREVAEELGLARELLERTLAVYHDQDDVGARELAFGSASPQGELATRVQRLTGCSPDGAEPEGAVTLMLAARALDRLRNLLGEMSEHVIFLTSGEDVRHVLDKP